MKKEIPTEPLSDESEWSDSADPSEDEELSSHYGEDEEEDGDVHESGGESDSSEDEESSLDDGEDRGTNRDVTKSVEESDSSEDELYVDWFVWEDKAHPLSNGPEPRSQKGDLFVQSGRTRRDISQVHTAPYRTRYSRRGMRQGQESSRVVDPEGLVVHPSFDFFFE